MLRFISFFLTLFTLSQTGFSQNAKTELGLFVKSGIISGSNIEYNGLESNNSVWFGTNNPNLTVQGGVRLASVGDVFLYGLKISIGTDKRSYEVYNQENDTEAKLIMHDPFVSFAPFIGFHLIQIKNSNIFITAEYEFFYFQDRTEIHSRENDPNFYYNVNKTTNSELTSSVNIGLDLDINSENNFWDNVGVGLWISYPFQVINRGEFELSNSESRITGEIETYRFAAGLGVYYNLFNW